MFAAPLGFWGIMFAALLLGLSYMHYKNDGNDRSTVSKMLTGTWLSNGVLLSFFGGVGLIVGSSQRNSAEHQLRRAVGGTDYPGLMMLAGVMVMLIGILCLGVHYSKKKENLIKKGGRNVSNIN